ncbi:hypothetical protein [Paenibacillus oceani]|uniref:Uncharacterized protein n=1 Tax=Paenibacillus oceani TaxID=2772510 RepID=A0A927CDS2_9BACL|nr:hypothetical protein [Paenibacillus oceani]MBD2864086.1 hypothetical protein [Paenibacillus oceani]
MSVTDDPVRINGQLIDNVHSKYPFITYGGITYLPLTWDHAIALGLGLGWDADTGLQIDSASPPAYGTSAAWTKPAFKQDLSASRVLPASYTAVKSAYPISIAGTSIDNSREEYPFLELQGITYMPLTWSVVNDQLKLTIYWDPENGLNVIGGQRQVLGNIVFDDANDLYISPSVMPPAGPGNLVKVSKSLSGEPVWMNQEESQKIQEQIKRTRLADPYRGTAAEVEEREDGLYYKGLKLLEKTEMVEPSGVSSKVEFSGTLFQLNNNRSLLAVQKRTVFTSASLRTGYVYIYSDGNAIPLGEFPQVPDKVIPNKDGSFWIASDIQFVHGHGLLDTLRLAHLNADGELKSMNREWNKLSVKMLGIGSRSFDFGEIGYANPQTEEGRIFVQLTPYPLDGERPTIEAGLYAVDSAQNLTLLSEPVPESAQLYVSSDKQLYSLGERVNTLRNISTGEAAMWYDCELLETE